VDNKAACPTFLSSHHEIVTGRGKMITARNLAQGYIKKDEGLSALVEGLFQCTFCKACEDECLTEIPLTEVYTELKTLIQEHLPNETKKLFQLLKRANNIYGMDQQDRDFWSFEVENIYDKWVNKSSEIGYFIGCVGSYYSVSAGAPVSLLKLAKLANDELAVFSPTEYCCGNPYILGGKLEQAKKLAEHNVNEIMKLGVKTLIVSCAGCYRMISNEYPNLLEKKLPFEIKTHMEYLLDLIKSEKLILRDQGLVKVSFKDPCELGRHCGVYDVARQLIALLPGVENREPANTKENALCCGAGGLLKVNYPEMAAEIADRLIVQMEEIGTELCLNACPSCLVNIDQQLKKNKSQIKAIDIAELVLDRTKKS
jgi:Fe-S oxidoreductase